jgi:hypothetical protein
MTHADPHAAAVPFSPAEVSELHGEDRKAAGRIVGLMCSIFVLGLIGYSLVCVWVLA